MKALLLMFAVIASTPALGDELEGRSYDYQRGSTAGFLDGFLSHQVGLPSVPDTSIGRSGDWQRGYDDGFDSGNQLDPQRPK